MTAAKDQIIALIPKLGPAELAEVQAALKFNGAMQGASDAPLLMSSDWVLNGIATYLIRRGLIEAQGALWGLKKRDAYKAYIHKLAPVAAFLARLEGQVKTHTRHRPQLAAICATALADWLEKRSIFSVSTMLSQIDKLPEALDEAYPGYVKAGLFSFVLRGRE